MSSQSDPTGDLTNTSSLSVVVEPLSGEAGNIIFKVSVQSWDAAKEYKEKKSEVFFSRGGHRAAAEINDRVLSLNLTKVNAEELPKFEEPKPAEPPQPAPAQT